MHLSLHQVKAKYWSMYTPRKQLSFHEECILNFTEGRCMLHKFEDEFPDTPTA